MASLIQTVTTPSLSSPTCNLELDFPWLVASSTPATQSPPVLPPAVTTNSLQGMAMWNLPAADTWSPVMGALSDPALFNADTSTPSRAHLQVSSSSYLSSPEPAANRSSSSSSGYSSLSSGSDSEASPVVPRKPTTAAPEQLKKPSGIKKPTTSYLQMIATALLSAPGRRMILQDMYAYIQQHYPYYKMTEGTWKNSVRHNLCVNECFMKSGRSNSSRGFFWTIHPACLEMFSKGDFSRTKSKRLAQKMYKSLQAASDSAAEAVSSRVHPTASSTPAPMVYGSSSNYTYSSTPVSAFTSRLPTPPTTPPGALASSSLPYMDTSSRASATSYPHHYTNYYGHQQGYTTSGMYPPSHLSSYPATVSPPGYNQQTYYPQQTSSSVLQSPSPMYNQYYQQGAAMRGSAQPTYQYQAAQLGASHHQYM